MTDAKSPDSLQERIRLARISTFFANSQGTPFSLAVTGLLFVPLVFSEGASLNALSLWIVLLLLVCSALFLFGRYVARLGLCAGNARWLFFVRCLLGGVATVLLGASVLLLPDGATHTAYCFVFILTTSVVAVGYLAYGTCFSYCVLVNTFSLFPFTFVCLYRFTQDRDYFFLLMGGGAIFWQLVLAAKALRVSRSVIGEIDARERLQDEMESRQAIELALVDSESKSHELASMLRRLCDNVPDMIWAKDLDGRYLFVNRAYCDCMLGEQDVEAPIGKTFEDYLDQERKRHSGESDWYTLGEFVRDVERHAAACHEATVFEESGQVRGRFVFLDNHLAPFVNAQGDVIGVVGSARDVTARKASEAYVQRLAYHDALTDLPNRALLIDRMTQAVAGAQREQGKIAVLFVDLDRLKAINDTLGHDVGDLLLQAVAQRMREVVARLSDTVARLGGDEFVVLLHRINRENDAEVLAGQLLERLASPFAISGQEIKISASIGIAIFPADGENAAGLLKRADIAMYAAKREGRNSFRFYDKNMVDGELVDGVQPLDRVGDRVESDRKSSTR